MSSFEQQFQNAVQYFNVGRLHEAQELCQKLLKKKARHSGVLQLLGEIARHTGDLQAAVDLFSKASVVDPKDALASFRLSTVLLRMGRLDDAIGALRSAVQVRPNFVEALCLLGDVLQSSGHAQEARRHFDLALRANPALPSTHFRLANELMLKRQVAAATRNFDMALRLKPDYWQAHVNLGLLLRSEGLLQQAKDHFRQALQIQPGMTVVYCYFLDLMLTLGELSAVKAMSEEVHTAVKRCVETAQERDFAAFLFLSPLLSMDKQDYHALMRKMDNLFGKPVTRRFPMRYTTGRKLRVGYVSPDFGDHPISHVMLHLFDQHDRHQIDVVGYSISTRTGIADRPYVEAIRESCDDFVDLSVMTVAQATERIMHDDIDILVNLSGYMCPQSLEIFAQRPAPIQVYWLGHGGGLGLSFIDYVIADAVVIPPGEEVGYRECVVRMPDLYHCTDTPPISDARQFRADFGLNEDAFVFCGFNNSNKIDHTVFDSWMNILRRVPNSQLWLSTSGNDGFLESNLRTEAELRGINPERLVFARRLDDKSLHFARHRLADLFLDTFVYSAATTAIDALWAGLPILTRLGGDFYSRICATLVRNVGLADMVCNSTREYEDRAVYFAETPAALAKIRERLVRNRHTEPLFDLSRFVRNLECAYGVMWRKYVLGEPPASFTVPQQSNH